MSDGGAGSTSGPREINGGRPVQFCKANSTASISNLVSGGLSLGKAYLGKVSIGASTNVFEYSY